MCVCLCVCLYVCMCVCVCVWVRACVCVCYQKHTRTNNTMMYGNLYKSSYFIEFCLNDTQA